jgi:CheY-like chemotaxis protein
VATIRLVHGTGPEGRERKLRLASLGHHVDFDDLDGPGLVKVLRRSLPDLYLIDLTRLPSMGREVAMWLRTHQPTRHVPIVFVDGDPQKVAKLRALLPDAAYTTWPRLKTAIPRAIASAPQAPVVPPSVIYTGRSVAEKLGMKAGMRVCVMGAPAGFVEALRPLPEGVTFAAKPDAAHDLYLAVARSRRELAAHLTTLDRHVARQTVWVAWPKKAARVATDLDGNVVRTTGLAGGWVDFKICAIDETWSGLAFKRRQ